jgi:hypothetical protein
MLRDQAKQRPNGNAISAHTRKQGKQPNSRYEGFEQGVPPLRAASGAKVNADVG